ncbi:fibronectin type III domain-containing protein [Candidatus Wolfebacteria bacterium]|nr:fibronectin type III domain-containing protein [Candidatus Wolfebacteria bacterium]
MKQKITGFLVIISLLFSPTSFIFAQTLDATAPTTDTTTATEPAPEPATTEPAPTTDTAPVEETVAPPADTTGPAFISVATASSLETEATVVWTTDELAYGFVEYGETASYGLSTPKSASAAMDHTVSITGLTPGTTYHYRIVAEDESGNISYSQDRTLETAVELVAIDNVPPEITNISVANITTSEATVSWMTDELAQGKIEYGKTAEYGASSLLTIDYATEHSAPLFNLDPDTEYHYRVVAQDESGNEAVSPDEIFITDAVQTITPTEEPVVAEPEPTATTTPETDTSTSTTTENTTTTITFAISHAETASIGTSTAIIIWKTNEPATSQVFYGASENYASSSAIAIDLALSHEIKLASLKSGTNYFYKVVSKNAFGKTIEKIGFEFNTLYKQKIVAVPPTISGIIVESIGTSTATIVFNTDIPAGGKINYGMTTAYEETDGGHNSFLVNHSHPLSGLKPNTTYNFETIVWDSSGNESIYENVTFATLSKAVSLKPELESEPVAVAPAPAPSQSFGGGGGHYYAPPKVVGKPVITKVDPRDKEVLFVWQKAKPESGLKTVIVKSENSYVVSPTQGTEVYRGNSGRFTDINLNNSQKYYYSVFRMSESGAYSIPLYFTVIPKQDKTQTKIIATPPVTQKTPIYTFFKILSRGNQNKQVEHLQVLLASESSIYQKGLITGYFGPLTERAVKIFQKRHNLSATGIADATTLKKLEQLGSIEAVKDKADVYGKALARNLTVGRAGGDVSVLQQFLVNAEVYPEALVTGYFGSLTKAAVAKFQKDQNISPASGYFGPITKKRMLNLIRLRSVSF